jgi:hypothetical protein
MLYTTLKSHVEAKGLVLVSLWRSGCAPFAIQEQVSAFAKAPKCLDYTERGIATLKAKLNSPPAFVVLSGYWSKLVHGQTYSEFVGGGSIGISAEKGAAKLVAALSKILGTLEEAGVAKTLLVGPTAELLYDPLDCALRSQGRQMDAEFCNVPAAKMKAWLEPAAAALKRAATPFKNTVFIEASDTLCDSTSCKSQIGGELLFPDTHHTSEAGTELLFEKTTLHQFFN